MGALREVRRRMLAGRHWACLVPASWRSARQRAALYAPLSDLRRQSSPICGALCPAPQSLCVPRLQGCWWLGQSRNRRPAFRLNSTARHTKKHLRQSSMSLRRRHGRCSILKEQPLDPVLPAVASRIDPVVHARQELGHQRNALHGTHEVNGSTLLKANRRGHQPLFGGLCASQLIGSLGAHFRKL